MQKGSAVQTSSSAQAPLLSSTRLIDRRLLIPLAALALLILAAYWPSIYPSSIWDDSDYLLLCKPVHSVGGIIDIWINPSATPHYFPVLHTAFWLEYRLWGLNLTAYHAMNVVYHAIAAGLLWMLLRQLKVPAAWFVAALWAVHPMQVESVAWISERKNILGSLFFFLAVLAYIHMPQTDARRRAMYYAGTLLAMAAAILTKQVMVVLPVILFLIDLWRDQRIVPARLKLVLPLLIPAALIAGIGIYQEKHVVGTLGPDFDFTIPQRFAIAGRALLFYLEKFILPWPLIAIYPRFDLNAMLIPGILLFLLFLALLATLWVSRRTIGLGPWIIAMLYVMFLLPALGFVSFFTQLYTFVTDHYAHMAIGALALGVGALLARIRSTLLMKSLSAVILAACVLISCSQSFLYRSELNLWTYALKHNPNSWVVLRNVAAMKTTELQRTNPHPTLPDYSEIIALYRRVLTLREDWFTYNNMGLIYQDLGDTTQAIAAFEKADALKPDFVRRIEERSPDTHLPSYPYIIGAAYEKRGQLDEAIAWYRKAVAARPGESSSWLNLGNCLVAREQYKEALDAYTQGTQAAPNRADLWFYRGILLRQLGQDEEGKKSLLQAHELDPDIINRVMKAPAQSR